jgi:coenzyme F420-reducing hydrogenase delta subunit
MTEPEKKASAPVTFEPRIVAILCHFCSYSAADGAARAKRALPAGLRTLRVLCTGRVEPDLVVRALQGGADGVLVCGCHPGDCHYVNGNCKALGRITLLQRLLADLGLEAGRLRLAWISAQEDEAYATLIHHMTDTVRSLGPLRWPANPAVWGGSGVSVAPGASRVNTGEGLPSGDTARGDTAGGDTTGGSAPEAAP